MGEYSVTFFVRYDYFALKNTYFSFFNLKTIKFTIFYLKKSNMV